MIGTSVTGLAVALGDGTGRFATELTVAAVGSEETIKPGDLNDDGRADEGESGQTRSSKPL